MTGLTRVDIDHILKLVDGSEFEELILEMGELKLELRKAGATPPIAQPAPAAPTSAPNQPQAAPPAPELTGEGQPVKSPLLGIFYHAPKPGADPFVAVGDRVTEDSVIGIIEVMKLMNQVTAKTTGIVTEILAPNGELVEHGQPLIRVKPD